MATNGVSSTARPGPEVPTHDAPPADRKDDPAGETTQEITKEDLEELATFTLPQSDGSSVTSACDGCKKLAQDMAEFKHKVCSLCSSRVYVLLIIPV